MKRKLKILVTAGPTQEMIDPVRFISNRSTGVMGYEVAKAARDRHHRVTLISGPTGLRPLTGVRFISIVSVGQLKKEVLSRLKENDCLFMVAAVSDWQVANFRSNKIRRAKKLKLVLKPTPDILELAGKRKGKRILVGFSLETAGGLAAPVKKLKKKNLDIIVANTLTRDSDPFGERRVRSSIIYKTGKVEGLPFIAKKKLARLLVDRIEKLKR